MVTSLNDRIADMCEIIGDIKDQKNNSFLLSIMNAMQLTPFELLMQISALNLEKSIDVQKLVDLRKAVQLI